MREIYRSCARLAIGPKPDRRLRLGALKNRQSGILELSQGVRFKAKSRARKRPPVALSM